MIFRLFALTALLTASALSAEPRYLFFSQETAKEWTRVALVIEGDQVSGTQTWQPKEGHGASGSLTGTLISGGLIKGVYEYTIEGSDQSEEQLLKLTDNSLFIGEGELVEGRQGRLELKNPSQVVFKKELKKVAFTEPKPGTPERKAIMDAMRAPVSAFAGKPVIFTGNVRVSGTWARFSGGVATADGKPATKPDVADEMQLDFFALLRQDAKVGWQVLKWGFAGDIGLAEEAREKYPKAPWILFQ